MSMAKKNSEEFAIPKKLKGDDGYKMFSLRIKGEKWQI